MRPYLYNEASSNKAHSSMQGKITVKEQRGRLVYELDRTLNRAAQARS